MQSLLRNVLGLSLVTVACSGPVFAQISGDYIEARSASVYGGACHYNGELTTAGREAVLGWNIKAGKSGKVDLAGLQVLALVSGQNNLASAGTTRRSVLLIDEKASPAQRDALVALLTKKMGDTFGTIEAVKPAPIVFTSQGQSVQVTAGDSVTLTAQKYPCSHCRMPAQTWYKPFAPKVTAQVAQGTVTAFADKTLALSWSQRESDNVFTGTFAL